VDEEGNGDFVTIQAAIDGAHAENPSELQPFTLLIAPGVYYESLTLYDHIHLIGLGKASAVKIVQEDQSVIRNGANCMLSNVCIRGNFSPMINISASFDGEMLLNQVVIAEQLAGVDSIHFSGGKLVLEQCWLGCGGSRVAILVN